MCHLQSCMSELPSILSANAVYGETFAEKAQLPLPPARKIAILTCMDARLDPQNSQV
jgi:carbonic anhydrase